MNKRYYEHTLPIIRGSLSNTYDKWMFPPGKGTLQSRRDNTFGNLLIKQNGYDKRLLRFGMTDRLRHSPGKATRTIHH